MVARCTCGLIWNISVKAKIPKKGYKCPICETKERKKATEDLAKVSSVARMDYKNILIRL